MRFAFTWDRHPIQRFSWLPGFEHRVIPFAWYFYHDGTRAKKFQHHIYFWWGHGQWHWVWNERAGSL